VLTSIKAEVDRTSQNDKVFQLKFDDMSSLETSFYCRLLEKLGFITTHSLEDPTGTYTYPRGITTEGENALLEVNKSFWKYAEKLALMIFQQSVRVDLQPFVDFFQSAHRKYQIEKDS